LKKKHCQNKRFASVFRLIYHASAAVLDLGRATPMNESGTVVFLGAGATKACGGPLTKEILPGILKGKITPPVPPGSFPQSTLDLFEDFLTKKGKQEITKISRPIWRSKKRL
jgi:hypothetical protein